MKPPSRPLALVFGPIVFTVLAAALSVPGSATAQPFDPLDGLPPGLGPAGGSGGGPAPPGNPGGPAPAPLPAPPGAPPPPPASPAAPQRPHAAVPPQICSDGPALTALEVRALLERAAAAVSTETLSVAVVDRLGIVLGVFRKPSAGPVEDERAVALARTGAFFSNNQAPLSSRTVRFISGIHFPPGVDRTPNAALYGIENTNRGCELGVTYNPGKNVPPAKRLAGGPCNAFDQSGCGIGPLTGKADVMDSRPGAVNPGGVPVFRGSTLVGGIGVSGAPPDQTEFAAVAAISAGFLPAVAAPGVVFIDGVRLPFVRQTQRPEGVAAGSPVGSFIGPVDNGRCVPEGYLVGPEGGATLSRGEVERIVNQAVAAARRTRAVIRLPLGSRARMAIAVADVDGEILALFRMSDSTLFSIDVAVSKARNVAYFSAAGSGELRGVPPGTAVTNRTLSFGAQPLYPAGIDGTPPGPFFDLFQSDTANPCSQGLEPPSRNQNGITFFPGSIPLYRGRTLIGGLGVSGDGVEQDDYVSLLGAEGFVPPRDLWADQIFVDGVRLPFLKLPRNPEG